MLEVLRLKFFLTALALIFIVFCTNLAAQTAEVEVVDARGLTRATMGVKKSATVYVYLNKGQPVESLSLQHVDSLYSANLGTVVGSGKFEFRGVRAGRWRIEVVPLSTSIKKVLIKSEK